MSRDIAEATQSLGCRDGVQPSHESGQGNHGHVIVLDGSEDA